MARRLTKNQEEFIQHIIAGESQREAYYKAYPNSRNWKQSNVDKEASRLMNKPHVQAYYQELRDEYMEHIKEQIFYDRDQLLNDFMFLKEEAKKSIEDYGVRQANSNAYINSLKNLAVKLPCTIFAHKFKKNARNYLHNCRNCCNLCAFLVRRHHHQGKIPQSARECKQGNEEARNRLCTVARPRSPQSEQACHRGKQQRGKRKRE